MSHMACEGPQEVRDRHAMRTAYVEVYFLDKRSGGGRGERDTERTRKQKQGPACLFGRVAKQEWKEIKSGKSLSLKGTF